MQHNDYRLLCDAIRKKCADERWYGAELDRPVGHYRSISDDIIPEYDYDEVVPADDPRRFRFEFAPATEGQLQETEATLGFPLPPVLRALYSQVANGGFGPGGGLLGTVGGATDQGPYTLACSYQSKRENLTLFDLESVEIPQATGFTFAYSRWPRYLLEICSWGCGVYIGLDSVTGQVFRLGPLEGEYRLTPLAASLEDWLFLWIRDKLHPRKSSSKETSNVLA